MKINVSRLEEQPRLAFSVIGGVYLLVAGEIALHWAEPASRREWTAATAALSFALLLAATLRCAGRVEGQVRRAWILMGGGFLLLLVGRLVLVFSPPAGISPASPSLPDVLRLAAAPLIVGGVLYLRQPNRLTHALQTLDILGLASALGILICSAFWSEIQRPSLAPAGRLLDVLYPILYGTLAVVALLLLARGMWRRRDHVLLATGLFLIAIPSLLAAGTFLHQHWSQSVALDLSRAVGALLLGLSALTFDPEPASSDENQTLGLTAWAAILVSATAMAVGYWNFHNLTLPPAAIQGLGGLFVLMLVTMALRLGLTLNHSRNLVREVRRTAQALQESEERFRILFEHSPDGVVLLDPHDQVALCSIIACNPAAARMNGYTPEELIGKPVDVLTRDIGTYEDVLDYLEEIRRAGTVVGEDIHYRKDGTAFPMEYSTSIVTLNGRELILGIDRDITDRKRAEEALAHRALHDALTDLPNRTLLRDRLHQAILASQRDGSSVGLLFMDLDRFKEVNDSYGHHAGDALLIQVALRLRRLISEPDTVARLGGDEFAVLLPTSDRARATGVMRDIIALFGDPLEAEGNTLEVGTSIGCALFPEHGDDASLLMRRADMAMYAAKRTGSVFTFYAPEHDRNNRERLGLMHDLRSALEGEGLSLHFQPLLHLRTGDVTGVEALIRWEHPVHGTLSPDSFIPAAEQSGLIGPLTEWVLDGALRQGAEWQAEGLDVGVAVNLSARTIHDQDVVARIAKSLRKWDVTASKLTVEITESAIILDPAAAYRTLSALQDLGVRVSIDDFGTGYSSLAHLKKLSVDQIKVDRSFVADMTTNGDSATIVRSVLDLGRNLGLEVVAEGVEDQDTEDMLRALNCDLVQGYHVGRPVPPPLLEPWLRAVRRRARLHLA
jgi:diguanylate cyclase (GGDEF)-like protein/PAS domain S-box-containing protein